MNRLFTKLSLLTVTVVSIASITGGSAFAAKPISVPLGNDISWPQCGRKLPTGQAFGIVGVNDGLANTTNPCFATELSWAKKSVGGTGQPLVALYVNTANPGLTGSWWPKTNDYPSGSTVANPYGTCDGSDTAACAYIYGYAKAYDDVNSRGVASPAGYLWWLDVETGNSWEFNNQPANVADLEGMVTYFQGIGAKVGIYSTTYQWGQIAGNVDAASNLNNLQSWIPGASSAASAKTACSSAQLTTNSPVTVTQFVSQNLDYDYSCI